MLTPGCKSTTRRKVRQVRRLSINSDQPRTRIAFDTRNGRHQSDGIWMLRIRVKLLGVCRFHDSSAVHHCHSIRIPSDDAEIVCNEYQRSLGLLRELIQQCKNLRLNRYIECRCWFISDDQSWFTS